MNRILFAWLVSGCLILPFSLNLVMASRSLSVWFALSQIILLTVLFLFGNKVAFMRMPMRFYLAFLGIFGFGFLSGISDISGAFSAFVFLAVACLVYLNVSIFMRMDVSLFEKTFKSFFAILFCLGLVSLFIRLLFPSLFVEIFGRNIRSVILIGEPSMFALLFGPVALWYGNSSNKNILMVVILLFFGIAFPNAIMLSYAVIYIFVLLLFAPTNRVIKLLFLIIPSSIVALVVSTQLSYFAPRLSLNPDDMNLSSLIYLVHWIEFWDVIFQPELLGNGFGQSKNITQTNDFIVRILELYGDDITHGSGVNAGHFFISRLAISIGYGVLIFIFLYSAGLFQSYKLQGKSNRHVISASFLIIIGFLPELILRTSGLLGFGLFWFILGLCVLQRETHTKSRRTNE